MSYYYFQVEGGDEKWRAVKDDKLDTVDGAMFITILSVDVPVSDDASKETLAEIKFKGPLYFDLDDSMSPASTAVFAMKLIGKLEEKGVFPKQLEIYASGGKGFHIIVPEECFLTKPPKGGMAMLPSVYKEMAFNLAVDSMDFRVYTARKGRMFRRPNVKRPNGLYKVRISYAELEALADKSRESKADAEAAYRELCSAPRRDLDIEQDAPELASDLMALFDQCKSKVSKFANKLKKQKPVTLPKELPSFDAILRGEGIKQDVGFNTLALQIVVTAQAKGMTKADLLEAAKPLCNNHEGDGGRYDTPDKRSHELARMWDYTDDNPCYSYAPAAVTALLTHTAPDLHGVAVSSEEVAENIADGGDGEEVSEYDHAGVIMTRNGAFTLTENGPKLVTALSFENVTELVSAETNQVSVMEADVLVAGRRAGKHTFELDTFNSTSNFNRVAMKFGQSFSGNDVQARGMYMRLVQNARKSGRRMYVINREGLDYVSIPFHEDEDVRKGFLVWSDCQGVVMDPTMEGKNLQMKFVGYPNPLGEFQTDLSDAPALVAWSKEGTNKEDMRTMLHHLFQCQSPTHLGKLLGWMTACHYRMLFHTAYSKFPLLHVNGSAGMGKTETTKLITNLHYFEAEPKMLTPNSTLFAVNYSAAASSSVPLILDEFKPSEMAPHVYDRFKLMLRDAYNCRSVERGGGTRDNADYRSVHRTQLSAPLCFIAEAAESESALMERVILLTLTKPPVIQAQAYYKHFQAAVENRQMLGVLGKYITAQIVKRYTVEQLKEEFDPIYNETRKQLMLQGDEVGLDEKQLRDKAGAKERTVYNYSVARFGLVKLRNLIRGLFQEEFDEYFQKMEDTVCSSVVEIQEQTQPEWLKVMNTLADMRRVSDMAPYYLQEGRDFAYLDYNGKSAIELYANGAYFKYRAYMAVSRSKVLFPSAAAFIHALNNIPALMERGSSHELDCPGGSHVFDLQELRAAGFLAP